MARLVGGLRCHVAHPRRQVDTIAGVGLEGGDPVRGGIPAQLQVVNDLAAAGRHHPKRVVGDALMGFDPRHTDDVGRRLNRVESAGRNQKGNVVMNSN